MNYAIIRNAKYTFNQINVIFRHNERKNTNYTNKDINASMKKVNYSLKECNVPYSKRVNRLRNEYNLKGKIKNTSNVACEYIITASPEVFEGLAENEIKRYFETAYKFVCGFKNLGEQYILSAKVHMDESNPHMHLVYLPVIHTMDKKSGKPIEKLCCTDFWKGKNSYKVLQDNFYKYVTRAGFELERGNNTDNKHIRIEDLKKITNYELQKYENNSIKLENEINTEDIEVLKQDYKRVIKKFNTLAKQYTKVKIINESTIEKVENIEKDYTKLKEEKREIEKENKILKTYMNKAFECISVLFDFPISRLKNIINNFIKESDKNDERTNNRNIE